MSDVWKLYLPALFGNFGKGPRLFQLQSYLYSKGKAPSQDCRKTVSLDAPISRAKPTHDQISLFLFRRVWVLVEGALFQRAHFSLFILHFYFKVYLLEWGGSFSNCSGVHKPLEDDLLGSSIYHFLFPFPSTGVSTQTEI